MEGNSMRWDFLSDFINKNNYKLLVEIGTAQGNNANRVLNKVKDDDFKLHTIDPYDVYDDFSFDEKNNKTVQNTNELKAKEVLQSEIDKGRCTMIKKYSGEASKSYEDGEVDIVFIDGNHSYKYVREDFELFLPKVKPGGILCGHDYGDPAWQGVTNAVNHCSRANNLKLELKNRDWFWFIRIKNEESS